MIGAALVAAVLAGLVASTAPTWPVTEAVLVALGQALVAADPTPARVDAVAVHGGGGARGEREHRAVELLRDGVTEQVVAMGGRLPVGDPDLTYARAVERRLLARDVSPSLILRFDVGRSTQGELVALRRLAEERGWRSLALATSSWHTRRVKLLAGQVFAGSGVSLSVVALDGDRGDLGDWWRDRWRRQLILGEWSKLATQAAWPASRIGSY